MTTTKEIRRAECAKQSARFFYYSELKRYERKKSFIGHQYLLSNGSKKMSYFHFLVDINKVREYCD